MIETDDELENVKQKLNDLQVLYNRLLGEQFKNDTRLQCMLQSKCIQLERQVRRLKRASDARQEMILEMENFALQIGEMASEASDESAGLGAGVDAQFLQKFSSSMIGKIRTFNNAHKEAKQQRFFVPRESIYLETEQRNQGEFLLQEMYSDETTMDDLPSLNVHAVNTLSKRMNHLYSLLIGTHVALEKTLVPALGRHEDAIVSRVGGDIARLVHAIEDCCDDMIELGAMVPGREPIERRTRRRRQSVDLRFDALDEGKLKDDDVGSFSISTREILDRLPPFSRNRRECERGLRSLVHCFHTQRNIWKMEKRALSDHIRFLSNVKTQTDARPLVSRPTAAPPKETSTENENIDTMLSHEEAECLKSTLELWHKFDADSNEHSLRAVLEGLSHAVPVISHMLTRQKDQRSPKRVRNQAGSNRHVPAQEEDFEAQEERHHAQQDKYEERKQKMEDKLRKENMYMEVEPDMSFVSIEDRGSVRTSSARRIRHVEQPPAAPYVSSDSISSSTPYQQRKYQSQKQNNLLQEEYDQLNRSTIDPLKRAYDDELSTSFSSSDDRSRMIGQSRVPVPQKKSSNSTPISQQSNIVALEEEISRCQRIISELQGHYDNEFNLSEPRRFALKKKIQQENAKKLRLERTLRQCLG